MGRHSIGDCAPGRPMVAAIAVATVHIPLRLCIYIAPNGVHHETRDSVPECTADSWQACTRKPESDSTM